jgi:hypothetical protein
VAAAAAGPGLVAPSPSADVSSLFCRPPPLLQLACSLEYERERGRRERLPRRPWRQSYVLNPHGSHPHNTSHKHQLQLSCVCIGVDGLWLWWVCRHACVSPKGWGSRVLSWLCAADEERRGGCQQQRLH